MKKILAKMVNKEWGWDITRQGILKDKRYAHQLRKYTQTPAGREARPLKKSLKNNEQMKIHYL